jgi:hypothetical protein
VSSLAAEPTRDARAEAATKTLLEKKAAIIFPDFSDTAAPSDYAPLLLHPHAAKMLAEGKYVPLDYFGSEARKRATEATAAGQLELGAGPGTGSSSPDPQIIPDVNLTWNEVSFCSTAMINYMVETGYPQRLTDSLKRMYSQLGSYNLMAYHGDEDLGDSVIIQYAADTRLQLYALKDSGKALFDIGKIFHSKLDAIKRQLINAHTTKMVRHLCNPTNNSLISLFCRFTFDPFPHRGYAFPRTCAFPHTRAYPRTRAFPHTRASSSHTTLMRHCTAHACSIMIITAAHARHTHIPLTRRHPSMRTHPFTTASRRRPLDIADEGAASHNSSGIKPRPQPFARRANLAERSRQLETFSGRRLGRRE